MLTYRLTRMEALTLSPAVLRWAADQAGESLESLAGAVAKRERDRARLLVRGQLTSSQAEKLAKLAGVPFGLLFLTEPLSSSGQQFPIFDRPSIPSRSA